MTCDAYFTVAQAARFLNLTVAEVAAHIADGTLPACDTGDGPCVSAGALCTFDSLRRTTT